MKIYISRYSILQRALIPAWLIVFLIYCLRPINIEYFLTIFFLLKYVDFSIGDDSGFLRFEDSKAAEKARMAAVLADEGGLIIKDHIITLEPVTGKNISFLLSLTDFAKLESSFYCYLL